MFFGVRSVTSASVTERHQLIWFSKKQGLMNLAAQQHVDALPPIWQPPNDHRASANKTLQVFTAPDRSVAPTAVQCADIVDSLQHRQPQRRVPYRARWPTGLVCTAHTIPANWKKKKRGRRSRRSRNKRKKKVNTGGGSGQPYRFSAMQTRVCTIKAAFSSSDGGTWKRSTNLRTSASGVANER